MVNLIEKASTSMSLGIGKFLGSRDRVAIAGNCPQASIEIMYALSTRDDNLGHDVFHKTSGLYLAGKCVDFELCATPRVSRLFGAIAKTNQRSSEGNISLIDVQTFYDSSSLDTKPDEEFSLFDSYCPYTSLSFNSNLESLSAGREDGTVLSWDLNAGKEVYRFNADACGVKKVQYLRTGQLLTLSSSNGGLNTPQLKIWDLRAKDQCIFALGRQSKGADKENVDTKRKARYTCVRSHPIDEKILTGTSTGSVVVWDLRSGEAVDYRVHSSAVTDCLVSPSEHGTVISSSTNGQVKCFNTAESPDESKSPVTDTHTLLDGPGSITGLDSDLDSAMILAVSSIGSFYRIQL